MIKMIIETDICIIGAGPVGLFAVFEAGLLKMRCHLIDALSQAGGQLTEIYPKKPIYDIPGYPVITAEQLIKNQLEQIAPFKPTFSLGERVEELRKQDSGSYEVIGSLGTVIKCQVVVIAGGLGCFEPRLPEVKNLDRYYPNYVHYMVKDPHHFRGKKIVIAGGGDSAMDWTNYLADIAGEITLVHRSNTFRGSPDSASKIYDLEKKGILKLLLSHRLDSLEGTDQLQRLNMTDHNNDPVSVDCDHFIALYGLSPKLGPIARWGLDLSMNSILVDTKDYSTNVERIYAIGDINSYQGKLNLILCGYHEAALMAQSAFKYVYPDKRLSFKYTKVNGINEF